MKLRLICHGMMLFWYKKPSTPGGDDDGYRILIPQGYVADQQGHGHLMHDLRFGIGAGVPDPHAHKWLLLAPNAVVPPREFDLRFGVAPRRHRTDEVPDSNRNLSFYENAGYRAVEDPNRIAYTIHVPYPHDETPLRVATYQAPPYKSGGVVGGFGVLPHRIVSARMLTFEIDNPNAGIYLYDRNAYQSSPVGTGSITGDLTLHLYSEPAHKPGANENHTHILNAMLKLSDKNANTSSDFDLTLNDQRKPTYDPEGLEVPSGLNFRDLLHLWEISALDNPGSPLHVRGPAFVDPAECGQGGGC
jgi:hypothetical protein